MIRRPDTSNRLIDTGDRLPDSLRLLSTGFLQQVCFGENLFLFHIPDTDRFFTTIDVMTSHDRVFVRSWRDADFDLGVFFGEGWEVVFEEEAIG